MIQLKDINISFEGKVIHQNFNLDIAKGEHFVISGESGRGKTTLLKLIAGIQIPDSGQVFVNGTELTSDTIDEIRSQIIWIPQNINLPVDTGLELIEMMNITSKKEEIINTLPQLNLEKTILSKNFSEVSGGEKQRIIIAICLNLEGAIVLLDEPTAALDSNSKEALLKLTKKLASKTIVSVSHDDFWINNTKNRIEL